MNEREWDEWDKQIWHFKKTTKWWIRGNSDDKLAHNIVEAEHWLLLDLNWRERRDALQSFNYPVQFAMHAATRTQARIYRLSQIAHVKAASVSMNYQLCSSHYEIMFFGRY